MTPSYKHTDVGVTPDGWHYLPITKVARLESGHTPSKRRPDYWGGGISWISLFDTQGLSKNEISATEKTITEDGLNNSSARLLPAGTVVFSRTATVGKTSVMASPMATSQDFANYICGPRLHNVFLVYLFRSMGRAWKTLMAGSIHNTIYMPTFKSLKILVPPLSEQKAIAATLCETDELIESLEQLLVKKRQIKQGAMQGLITGQRRLPGFSAKWKDATVGTLGEFFKGSGVTRDQAKSGTLACVRYGEIYTVHSNYIREFSSLISKEVAVGATRLKQGDLLFAGSGETKAEIGKCVAFVDDVEAYAGGDIVILRPRYCDSKFLGYALNTEAVIRQKASRGQGDAVVHISANALSTVTVRMPNLDEQTAIASVLCSIDTEIIALETKLQKARHLKQGMMQELLTGRIRLV